MWLKLRLIRIAQAALLLQVPTPAAAAPPPVRGFALAPHFEGTRSRASVLQMVDAVADQGATHLEVVVQWGQADIWSTEIRPYQWGTDDAEIAAVVDRAHARGLAVLLFPILRIEHTEGGAWRGRLSPSDPDAWWRAYSAFVIHYAELAQVWRVAWLSLGSELSSLEADEARWWHLAAAVRARFRGRLTYSANWDHFTAVPFWRALDAVGVNGYFPLARQGDESPESLRATWSSLIATLALWRRASGLASRPLWFTEVGYPSMQGAAHRPYHHVPDAAVDLAVQRDAFDALATAMAADSTVAGVFVWAWTGSGGAGDRGYAVQSKPAQHRIRAWFTGGESSINSKD